MWITKLQLCLAGLEQGNRGVRWNGNIGVICHLPLSGL